MSQAIVRLTKEFKAYMKSLNKQIEQYGEITDRYLLQPDQDDLLVWYFVFWGLDDSPFQGGFYLGKIEFKKEYPFKPPTIFMLTDTGRVATGGSVCLSISQHHPESWNPQWSVSSILVGLISVLNSNEVLFGQTVYSDARKREIASNSVAKVTKNPIFLKYF